MVHTPYTRGRVPGLARAWLQVFVGQYQPIAGSDDCAWLATRELTFPLFVLTLYSVQGGKSVFTVAGNVG
jgi:hypothetical protein